MNTDLYDFPMSHGCYRAMCRLNGEPVPPNVDIEIWTKTEDEYRQQFIKWQDKERMGLPQRVMPVPMQATPSCPQIPQKPIIKKQHTSKRKDGF